MKIDLKTKYKINVMVKVRTFKIIFGFTIFSCDFYH